MIPKNAISIWKAWTQILHKFHLIPYKWDAGKNCIAIDDDRRTSSHIIFVVQCVIILLYELFLVLRGVQELASADELFVAKIPLLFSIVLYVLFNGNQWIMYQNFELYPVLLQDLLVLGQKFRLPRGDENEGKQLRRGMILILVTTITSAFFRALGVFRNPKFPALLSSLHPTPENLPFAVKAVLAAVHLQINAFHYMVFAFNLMSILCYNFGVVKLVKQLRIDASSTPTLASVEYLAFKYQKVCVLQRHFNSIVPMCVFCWQLTGISASSVNLFIGLVAGSPKGAIVGTLAAAILFVEFRTFAAVHEESVRVLDSWKHVINPVWFRKYYRSCLPLSVRVASYYDVNMRLVLTLLSVVTTVTANLVLTFMYD